MSKWTTEDLDLLMATVEKTPVRRDAFEKVGKATGRSANTVQQKFYTVKAQAKKKPKAQPGRHGKALSLVNDDANRTLGKMSMHQLIELIDSAWAEVDSRRKVLDQASSMFRAS